MSEETRNGRAAAADPVRQRPHQGVVFHDTGDLALCCVHVDEKGATFRVWPRVEAVCRALDDLARPGVWAARYFACGRAVYCGLALWDEQARDYAYRDAPCPACYALGADAAQREADGALLAAAAMWGVGAGLLRMPDIFVPAANVQINPVAGPDGKTIRSYTLGERLTLEQVAYGPGGQVEAVQIARGTGGKVLWKRK